MNAQEMTSYHEAGHILLAYERYGRNLRVALDATDSELGFAFFRLRGFVVNDHVRVALAGVTTEWLSSGTWSWKAADLDLAAVAEWRAQYAAFVGAQEADRELEYCIDYVGSTLVSNWVVVQVLAGALAAELMLQHDRVEQLVAEATSGQAKAPPRQWDSVPRDELVSHLAEREPMYRQLAQSEGLCDDIAAGLVSIKWMTPALFARQKRVMAAMSRYLRSRREPGARLPRSLQRQLDGLNKARDAAARLRGDEEVVSAEIGRWLTE